MYKKEFFKSLEFRVDRLKREQRNTSGATDVSLKKSKNKYNEKVLV